jgi:hypothetical protein
MCSFFILRSLSPDPLTPNLHIFVPSPTPSSWILLDASLAPADVFFRLPLLTLARCWYALSEMSHIWLGKTQGIGVPNQALWNTRIELLNSGSVSRKSYRMESLFASRAWNGGVGRTEAYKLMLSLYTSWRRVREVDIFLYSLLPWALDGAEWLTSRHVALWPWKGPTWIGASVDPRVGLDIL